MDYLRLTRILIIFSFSFVFYIYMGIKLIKRNRNTLTTYLFLFYVFESVIFILNIIWAFIFNDSVVLLLYLLAVYIGSLGFGFMLLFNVSLLKIDSNFSSVKQLLFMVVFATLLLGVFFIPNGVTINESTDWKPVYNINFALYLIMVDSLMAIIPLSIISIKTYRKIENNRIKRKYLYYISGLYLYFLVLYATVIFNYLNDASLSVIYFMVALIALPSAYLMYYGINNF